MTHNLSIQNTYVHIVVHHSASFLGLLICPAHNYFELIACACQQKHAEKAHLSLFPLLPGRPLLQNKTPCSTFSHHNRPVTPPTSPLTDCQAGQVALLPSGKLCPPNKAYYACTLASSAGRAVLLMRPS